MSESSGLRPRHLNRVLAPEGEVLGLGPSLVLLRSSAHRALANSSAAKYAARLKQGIA